MKNVFIAILLVLTLAVCVDAQEQVRGLTGKGIKVGINISNFSGSEVGMVSARTGFGFGGFLTYNLSPQFAVQPEVLYMQKGTEYDFIATMTWAANYFEIPVLAKYTIPTSGNIKPGFFAGPAVALLLGSSIKVEYEGVTELDWDVKDGLKSTDFGLVFGGGVTYQMTSVSLTFDIRYTLGLTKFIDVEGFNSLEPPDGSEPPVTDEEVDSKNQNLSFLVGVSF